jgi:hypothetical protein
MKGKIFASLLEENETANIKCSVDDQSIYCSFDKKHIYPVPNKFGSQGWTTFELRHLTEKLWRMLYMRVIRWHIKNRIGNSILVLRKVVA